MECSTIYACTLELFERRLMFAGLVSVSGEYSIFGHAGDTTAVHAEMYTIVYSLTITAAIQVVFQ